MIKGACPLADVCAMGVYDRVEREHATKMEVRKRDGIQIERTRTKL